MQSKDFIQISPGVESGISRITATLVDEYLLTSYRIEVPTQMTLRIGEASEQLKSVYDELGAGTAAFVTAYNPYSQSLSDDENRKRHARLRDRVAQAGHAAFEGAGYGRDPAWAPERSFLVIGISLVDAVALGDEFEQNAIVFAAEDAVPKLVLLR